MLVHQSICLCKLSMITCTVQKVISGQSESSFLKCLQDILLGKLKLNLISKDKSKQFLSKVLFLVIFPGLQLTSYSNLSSSTKP